MNNKDSLFSESPCCSFIYYEDITMSGSAEAVEKITSSLSNLIPQLFFDMIARFLPGLVIILSFNFVLNNIIEKLKVTYDYPYLKYVVFVIACYYASIIFYGLWCAVNSLLRKILQKEKKELDDDFSLRHDFIKLNAPNAGNRIAKLKAEKHMSCELTVAFSFCFIISIFTRFDISCLFFFAGSIGLFFSYRHFSERFRRAIGSCSTIIGYNERSFTLPDKFKTKK